MATIKSIRVSRVLWTIVQAVQEECFTATVVGVLPTQGTVPPVPSQ
jgi:hypothetical protein